MHTRKSLAILIGLALAAQAEAAPQKSPENSIMPSGSAVSRLQVDGALPGIECTGSGGSGCPQAIADQGSGSSTIDIAGCGELFDVNVGLDVTHSWVGDLVFTLTSPEGTPVTIMDRPGVPTSTFGCSGNNIFATFDDDALVDVETQCLTDPAISGAVIPNNPLALLNGESGTGQWTLSYEDVAGADAGTLNDWSLELDCEAPTDRATFPVYKVFSDGNPAEVEVTLLCDTGLPLEQSFIISEGEPVLFVVTNYADGEMNCTVTESVPEGYEAEYLASGGVLSSTSCEFENVAFSEVNTCRITNTPLPVEVEITKEWVYEGDGISDIDTRFSLYLECDAPILGDSTFNGTGEATFTTEVLPSYLGNTCSVSEIVYDAAVVPENGCAEFEIGVGNGHSCTVTNTVFFEGIPALSNYGLAILALSMLGLGFVGFRRLV